MDKQAVFDRVVAHARLQGKRARDANKCAYRAPDGAACFIGALISDEAYSEGIEGHGVLHCLVLDALLKSGIDVTSMVKENFWTDLQNIHDDCLPESWEEELKLFADLYQLNYSPPAAASAKAGE